MIDREQEFLDALHFKLSRNSEWREFKAKQFADDPRNARAAALLRQIAANCQSVPAEKWQKIEPHFQPSAKNWLDAVSATCRDVGFRSEVRDLDGYLDELISNLSKPTRH